MMTQQTSLDMPRNRFSNISNVLKAALARASANNDGLLAAGVAFYLFLALVPLLASVVMVYGLLASPETLARHMARIATALPPSAANLIAEQLRAVVQSSQKSQGIGLAIALGLALFGARNGAGSLIIALNVAFGCTEARGFVRRNLVAIAITLGSVLAAILTVAAITAFAALQSDILPASHALSMAGQATTWLVLLVALATIIAGLYSRAPACHPGGWRLLRFGPVLAALGIAVLTYGFGAFVANLGNYNATYGSLAGVVVLLTWLWLTSYAVLLGAEVEAVMLDRND